jgi:hypothetical protein
MRPETREYPFDWMLWRTFVEASRMKRGTEKEYRTTLAKVPYFRGIVGRILDAGKPGEAFLSLCADYLDNMVHARERGLKNAITTFCFNPALLYAMGVTPICLEILTTMMSLTYRRGTGEFLDYCNEIGFTETSCSSQRGALGAILAGVSSEVDLVLTDSAGICDTNANAFAFASAYLEKPFYQLDMPPRLTGESSRDYHRQDFRALIRFLEAHTGRVLDRERLLTVILEMEKQDRLIAELEDMARLIPNPLPGIFQLFVYGSRFMFAGMPKCTRVLEAMVEAGRANAQAGRAGMKSGQERLRALFCYIDHYSQNLRLWQFLDTHGITTCGNILSHIWSQRSPYVRLTGNMEEGYRLEKPDLDRMIDSLAEQNARMPMVKSIRGPYDQKEMWLSETLALGGIYNIDLIVYNGTPGCRNTWGMIKLLARDTEAAGFPTYIMYADAFDDRVESWETTRERFEEFLTIRRLI